MYITLTLTEKEAMTLASVLVSVGGDPRCSRRKHTNAVQDKLLSEGVNWRNDPFSKDRYYPADITGIIVFELMEEKGLKVPEAWQNYHG